MIRVGIVGTGRTFGIAHYHAIGLINDGRAQIEAVYNNTKEMAEKWVNDHSLNARVCDSFDELLDIVDAVCICVPNDSHYYYVKKTIEAKKHFLVEKPLSLDIEESRDLKLLVQNYEEVNMVGFVNRYSESVIKAKEIVSSKMGKVYTFTAWYGGKRLSDPRVPLEWRMIKSKAGTGALGDFGSHLIDLAYFIAGHRYNSVSCVTKKHIPIRKGGEIENDDSAMFVADSEQGIGSFTVSRTGFDDLIILLVGDGGHIRISYKDGERVKYWEKETTGGYTDKVYEYYFPDSSLEKRFNGQMTAFLDAIENKIVDYPRVSDGAYVQEVLEAADRVSKSSLEEVCD